MVLFGRLIALVLRLGGGVHNAVLCQYAPWLLITEGPFVHPNHDFVEAAFYIRKEAMDVLGLLGFRVFSTENLQARFCFKIPIVCRFCHR